MLEIKKEWRNTQREIQRTYARLGWPLRWQMPSFSQIWANFLSHILDVEEFQRYDNK